jgi:hypothetical protein
MYGLSDDIWSKNIFIMCGNAPIMDINFNEGRYLILNEKLLPPVMKNSIQRVPSFEEIKTEYDYTQMQRAISKNRSIVTLWLAGRVLSLSRANAKWIYNALRFEQLSSEYEKAKVALFFKAVSVLDNYWVKEASSNLRWEDVNIRKVPLNESIRLIALHGKSVSVQGPMNTPELTTHGAYAKAWSRHEDGLWLYKKGHNGNTESRIEVMVSKLLDKTNARHCHYEAGEDDGHYVCMCPAMTNDNLSILSGTDFNTYCNRNNLNFMQEILKIDSNGFYTMWVVDYLIANRDRHGGNWGLYYNPDTLEFISTHPLYDHNNAFDIEWMNNPDADYQFNNMTIRQAAHYAINKCGFKITQEITREDFLTDRQYKCFMSRARELKLIL